MALYKFNDHAQNTLEVGGQVVHGGETVELESEQAADPRLELADENTQHDEPVESAAPPADPQVTHADSPETQQRDETGEGITLQPGPQPATE